MVRAKEVQNFALEAKAEGRTYKRCSTKARFPRGEATRRLTDLEKQRKRSPKLVGEAWPRWTARVHLSRGCGKAERGGKCVEKGMA